MKEFILFAAVSLLQCGIAASKTYDFPKQLVVSLDFQLNFSPDSKPTVEYEIASLGKFQVTNFTWNKNKIQFLHLPLSYAKETVFTVRSGKKEQRFKRNFSKEPFEPWYSEIKSKIEVLGTFGTPFIGLAWPLYVPMTIVGEQTRALVPLILNRWGEPIWMRDSVTERKRSRLWGTSMAVTSDREILLMERANESHFQKLSFFGDQKDEFSFSLNKEDRTNSHEIEIVPGKNGDDELLMIALDCRAIKEEFPHVKNEISASVRKSSGAIKYIGDSFLRMPLRKFSIQNAKEIWNTWKTLNPIKDFSKALSVFTPADMILDAHTDIQYKEAVEALRGSNNIHWDPNKNCDVDWTHSNSFQYFPGHGYLISIRNLNRVVLIDESGKLIWSLGEDASNSIRIVDSKDAFSMQHSAMINSRNEVMLYDNGAIYRGGSLPKGLQTRLVSYRIENGKAQLAFSLPLVGPPSTVRGSVKEFSKERYLVYSAGDPWNPGFLYDVSRKGERLVAGMKLSLKGIYRGISAIPLSQLQDLRLADLIPKSDGLQNDFFFFDQNPTPEYGDGGQIGGKPY